MKKVAGTLKLDQAQYRELEAFAKFGSDLDAATKSVLDKGARNVEILKQREGDPFTVERQIAIIYVGTKGLIQNVPIDKVKDFEKEYLDFSLFFAFKSFYSWSSTCLSMAYKMRALPLLARYLVSQ